MKHETCRICGQPLADTFVDLGLSPLSNQFVRREDAELPAVFYPLKAMVCSHCFLVQVGEFEAPEHIFGEYVYFSSFSDSWLKHAEQYAAMMRTRFGLHPGGGHGGADAAAVGADGGHGTSVSAGEGPLIVEIACNDGYLLQYFKSAGLRTLGIEPARNVAEAARAKGIPVVAEFFGTKLADRLVQEGKQADVLIGNNVLAHVPDLHDFVGGLKRLLRGTGVLTMEFPHILELIRHNQFDTIYHEHFSYFSFYTVSRLFASHGLVLFDVEKLPTHGGSLRIFARHMENEAIPVSARVEELLQEEREAGLLQMAAYHAFAGRVMQLKRSIWAFLLEELEAGRTIAAYGAPAKGNTLLNYCGIGRDMIGFAADRNPHKQGLFLPGSLIPVYPPEVMEELKPDVVIIMPWNLKDEIAEQLSYIRGWGGQFAVLLPEIEVWRP